MSEVYRFLPLHERQIQLEKDMRGIGFKRLTGEESDAAKAMSDEARGLVRAGGSIAQARLDERESETPYGHMLLMKIVDPLSKLVARFVEESYTGKAGRHASAAVKLKLVSADAAAYLTAKTVLNSLSINKMEQTVAHEVGRAIEEEARFQSYQQQNPALMDTIKRDHKRRRKNARYTKRVLKGRLAKAGAEWQEWAERDCIILGLTLISLFIDTGLGYVKRDPMAVRKKRNQKPPFRLTLGENIDQLIADMTEHRSLLTPGFLPTVVPPRRWTSPVDGAYWTGAVDRRARKLVKTRNTNYLEDLRHTAMPHVYEAVNAVQGTAWRINTRVLDVMTEAWGKREIGSLPSGGNEHEPTKPSVPPPCRCYCEDKKAWAKTPEGRAWRAWRRQAHEVHEYNAKMKSRRFQAATTMQIARMFEKDEAIYFPHQLDFRSRVYPMPMFLNPQGPDYVRGLLMFAEGKAITNPAAKNWLAVHGANSYGIDKVSFHERVDWVRKNQDYIERTAEDPMGMVNWWGEAENPWQFLAFCFEWADFTLQGYGFFSHLPVSLDGTCNGLQHFSAMLRDPVGGAAVNLLPADKPQDIYQRVADRVIEHLTQDADPMAERWLAFGVDRKLTKRPVMILPYGGTQYACRKYVEEHVLKLIRDRKESNPFGADLMDAVVYLSEIIWHAIGETVVAAKDAMQWLRSVARLMAKEQLAIVWQTPAGFPVRQAYPETRSARVDFVVDGSRMQRFYDVETDGLDKDEQVNGLSPNFVHSLDAAALMESVRRCRIRGIRSFAMVHDSYGTHAADTEALSHTLRGAFVDLYRDHNVLAELRTAVVAALPAGTQVPPVPQAGTLNIDAVMDSRFFFA